jgi:hypothetical protein
MSGEENQDAYHRWIFMTENQNQDAYQEYMDQQQIEDSYYDHIFFSTTYRVQEQTEHAVFSKDEYKNQSQEEAIRDKYIQKMIDQDDYNPTRSEMLRLQELAREEEEEAAYLS